MSEESDLEEGSTSQAGEKKKKNKSSKRLQDADFSTLEGGKEGEESAAPAGEESAPDETAEALRSGQRDTDDYREKYLRALAETENYKKRALKDRAELIKYQGERILFDFLNIIDNLELALQHSQGDADKFREGIEMIHRQFLEVLSRWDVRAESGIGQDFDPTKFSAISRVPVHDATPGTIISELKKAYHYKDKLLRPGEVVVAEAAPVNSDDDDDDPEEETEESS